MSMLLGRNQSNPAGAQRRQAQGPGLSSLRNTAGGLLARQRQDQSQNMSTADFAALQRQLNRGATPTAGGAGAMQRSPFTSRTRQVQQQFAQTPAVAETTAMTPPPPTPTSTLPAVGSPTSTAPTTPWKRWTEEDQTQVDLAEGRTGEQNEPAPTPPPTTEPEPTPTTTEPTTTTTEPTFAEQVATNSAEVEAERLRLEQEKQLREYYALYPWLDPANAWLYDMTAAGDGGSAGGDGGGAGAGSGDAGSGGEGGSGTGGDGGGGGAW